jgi:AcrR family transcriptional regulator
MMGRMSAPTTLDLLWGSPQRPKRGPKPSLTLERIVAEAIEHADAEGLASLSMQRLAERLGCAKMALYRYVPGKAELGALMLDAALGPAPDPAAAGPATPGAPGEGGEGGERWRAPLRAWAMTMFERMRAHPWAHELAQGVRPIGPNEVGWMESALTTLAGSGLTGAEGLDTIALLAGHVRGLALQASAAGDGSLEAALGRQVSEGLAAQADRYPRTVAAFAESGPPGARDNALGFGIDRILDGLGVLIAARAR